MSDFVTALTAAIDADALWGVLTPMVSLIGVVVLFALGVHFGRRLINGVSKGKAKI